MYFSIIAFFSSFCNVCTIVHSSTIAFLWMGPTLLQPSLSTFNVHVRIFMCMYGLGLARGFIGGHKIFYFIKFSDLAVCRRMLYRHPPPSAPPFETCPQVVVVLVDIVLAQLVLAQSSPLAFVLAVVVTQVWFFVPFCWYHGGIFPSGSTSMRLLRDMTGPTSFCPAGSHCPRVTTYVAVTSFGCVIFLLSWTGSRRVKRSASSTPCSDRLRVPCGDGILSPGKNVSGPLWLWLIPVPVSWVIASSRRPCVL